MILSVLLLFWKCGNLLHGGIVNAAFGISLSGTYIKLMLFYNFNKSVSLLSLSGIRSKI